VIRKVGAVCRDANEHPINLDIFWGKCITERVTEVKDIFF
jgi:hypothetical protein